MKETLESLLLFGTGATMITAANCALAYCMGASHMNGLKNGMAGLQVAWNIISKVPIQDIYKLTKSTHSEDKKLSKKYKHLTEPYVDHRFMGANI
ncbi:MAG: hypothetical protein AABW88_00425 [Nanoarchaeota archaeon]